MDLVQALRFTRATRAALVGAGGKTTALFQLARAFESPVVVTCSTHLGAWQADFADRHVTLARPEDVDRFAGQIEGVTLFTGPQTADERLSGLDMDTLSAIHEAADRLKFPVLIEADGSRQRPLKAPAENEPVIPGWVNHVLVMAGLSALGKPLESGTVHRAERFGALSGLSQGELITPEAAARVLAHPQGGLKNIPAGARKTALLNQADTPELEAAAFRIAKMIEGAFDAVLVTELAEQKIRGRIEQVAGILLAGGGSSRFGQPKMLLPWHGKPLIRHAAEAALAGGLSPVVVVSGAADAEVREALAGLPVTVTQNPNWQVGQSTSVRQGLRALPASLSGAPGAAIFLLADQPFVTAGLIQAILQRWQTSLAPVVAPRVGDRRSNPVLFDRSVFPDLLALEGDTGGRAVMSRYAVEYLDWEDPRLLLDIDTPEDYERLKGMA